MAAHIDGRLHWERQGPAGPPLVLVHCNPMDLDCWLYQTAHLSTWFRTIAVDLPGYGRSPAATAGLTMDDVAQACWEAVDASTTDAAVLVGLSVGASVVAHMAAQRPGRTLALVLSGTGYHQPWKTFEHRIDAFRQQGLAYRYGYVLSLFGERFRDTDLARHLARMFAERTADVETICEMFRALGTPPAPGFFERLHVPALIITGSEDVAHAAAFELQRRIAGCELAVIAGAGHACNLEQPWLFDLHLLRFLARHGIGGPLPAPGGG